MPDDLLLKRLRSLKENDILLLLTEGLRVNSKELSGLTGEDLILRCSKDLRAAAGSSTKNKFRGDHEFPYKQILIDVADKIAEGYTFLSWTKYSLKDSHSEQEIEEALIRIFEERARKWWNKLSDEEKSKFVDGLNSVLSGDEGIPADVKAEIMTFLTQQAIENVIQYGIMSGITKVAAPSLLGAFGVTVVGHVGWMILLQTVGLMGGLKIFVFGIGGAGAWGGAIGTLGGVAIGGALSIPTLAVMLDGPAYRKTVPTVIMLLAKGRMNSLIDFESRASLPSNSGCVA